MLRQRQRIGRQQQGAARRGDRARQLGDRGRAFGRAADIADVNRANATGVAEHNLRVNFRVGLAAVAQQDEGQSWIARQ